MKEARAQWKRAMMGRRAEHRRKSSDGKKIGRLLEKEREGGTQGTGERNRAQAERERKTAEKKTKCTCLHFVERKERD